MSFDDQIRAALDGTTASLREHLEAQLRAFAQEAARVATEERQRAAEERQQALKEASEQAAGEKQQALKEASERAAEEKEQALKEASERAAEERQQGVRAASEAVAAEVRAQAEVLVTDVRSQAEAQVAQIRAAAQKHAEELKRAAETQIAELRKALEELRAQAQQQLDTARRIAQTEIDKAHAEIDKARAEAQAETEKVRAEAQAETGNARVETERARGEAEAARAEADVSRAETEAVRAQAKEEVARVQAEIETHKKAAAGEAEEVLIARLAAADTVSERKIAEAIDRARTDSHQTELSRAARLAGATRNLDEARGLSEVLERLVQGAGQEVDRAAVLLVKGVRLAGWRLAGFAPGTPPAKSIDLSVSEAGLAGAVLKSGEAASRPSDAAEGPGLPPFAANAGERHAMALPVRVGGEVVAVLYADAPRVNELSSDARWPAILEVLVRHASRVLEAMTVEQAAGLSLPRPLARGSHSAVPGPVEQAGNGDEETTARRYARLLLSEIRMYHEPIVDAGRRSGDLMSRLHGEIERARRLYEARVPESVQARAEYFDQELVRTLAGGDRTLLGTAQ